MVNNDYFLNHIFLKKYDLKNNRYLPLLNESTLNDNSLKSSFNLLTSSTKNEWFLYTSSI